MSLICAGVYLGGSIFLGNIGMKKHNGGAATILCDFIIDTTSKDYYHTSAFIDTYILFETLRPLQDPVEDLYSNNLVY